ncbi:hypothetical protein AOLI_G00043550 [Acnodon oligacanthus]
MAHGSSTCHHITPSDSETLTMSLESEENFEHRIEQLTGEEKLSGMMDSEEVPTSDLNCFNSEADSLQDICHEPPWSEDRKSDESAGEEHQLTHTTSADSSQPQSPSPLLFENPVDE